MMENLPLITSVFVDMLCIVPPKQL